MREIAAINICLLKEYTVAKNKRNDKKYFVIPLHTITETVNKILFATIYNIKNIFFPSKIYCVEINFEPTQFRNAFFLFLSSEHKKEHLSKPYST